MTFYSSKDARDRVRGKKVRSIRWQNNASGDIVGATGLWPSLAGLDDSLYRDIDKLIWDIWHNYQQSYVDLHQGRYALMFGTRLAAMQQKLDEAAAVAGSDPADVSLAFKENGINREPIVTVTTVTSGTQFIFELSSATIDFGEEGSTQRALSALQGLRNSGKSTGYVTFVDGSDDGSGYLTREVLEEESQRQ